MPEHDVLDVLFGFLGPAVDFSHERNLIIASVIPVIGIPPHLLMPGREAATIRV